MIIIKIEEYLDRFISKCIKNNITLYHIEYHDNFILVTINEKDLKRIKKLNYYSKITKYDYYGKNKIIKVIKNNIYNIIMFIFFILLLYFWSNIIITVEVKHENKEIINNINELLLDYDVKKYTLVKSNKKLNEISDRILESNRDFLDFLSITRVGMKYVVNVEERILKVPKKENKYCHIIANKDGIITSINDISGITVKEKGEYVKKGDIIISGSIILNEEIKDNICAKGEVMANTWYKVNVKYPLIKTKKDYTKRVKININIFGKYLKKRLYKNYDEEVLFKFKNVKIVRQKEYKLIQYKEEIELAKTRAIEEAIKKLLEKLNKKSEVIDKKVLNSSINNSTIELELFISINESIGEMVNYEAKEIGETNDTS